MTEKNCTPKKVTYWNFEEVNNFLAICLELKVPDAMDGKKFSNLRLFKKVYEKMKEFGYTKTITQLITKYKKMKQDYFKVKASNNKSGAARHTIDFMEKLNELFSLRPRKVYPEVAGVDSGEVTENFSCVSCELSEDESERQQNGDSLQLNHGQQNNPASETPRVSQITSRRGGRQSYLKGVEKMVNLFTEKQEELQATFIEEQKQMLNEFKNMQKDRQEWEEKQAEENRRFFQEMFAENRPQSTGYFLMQTPEN